MKKVWILVFTCIVLASTAALSACSGRTQTDLVLDDITQKSSPPVPDAQSPVETPSTDTPEEYEPRYNLLPGGIGANLNEHITTINYDDLELTGTKWVRGFINYFGADSETSARILSFQRLKEAGYHTIVSIKFNYTGMKMPTTQEGYNRTFADLEDFLDQIYPYTDVIVSGNEPFIESLKEERNEIVINFYKEVTQRIHNYIIGQEREIPLFVGAVNQVWEPLFWDDFHEKDFVQYAAETPWIAGVDVHIHHQTMEEFDTSLKRISELLRDDQKIIATEFSLMKYWKSHTSEPIPQIMSEKYGYDSAWKVYEYIGHAVKNRAQITREEWEDFLGSCSWYTDAQDYLLEAYGRFLQDRHFYAATYGMYIFWGTSNAFTDTTDPWLLNPLFATSTVQNGEDNRYQPNYKMLENFQLIQEMMVSENAYVLGALDTPSLDVACGTALEDIVAQLPEVVRFLTSKGPAELSVSDWNCTSEFDPDVPGRYMFTAEKVALPDMLVNPKDYTAQANILVYRDPQSAEAAAIELPAPGGSDVWFKFDEADGSLCVTDSINGFVSTAFHGKFLDHGIFEGCVSFEDKKDGIQLGTAGAPGGTFFNSGFSKRTLTFWFNASSIDGKQMLAELGGSLAGMAVRINNGILEAAIATSSDGSSPVTTQVGNITLNEKDVGRWIHIALSFNEGKCEFYVDGKLVGEGTAAEASVRDAKNPSDIACNSNGSNAFNDGDVSQNFVGLIDDLRIYTSAVVPTVCES